PILIGVSYALPHSRSGLVRPRHLVVVVTARWTECRTAVTHPRKAAGTTGPAATLPPGALRVQRPCDRMRAMRPPGTHIAHIWSHGRAATSPSRPTALVPVRADQYGQAMSLLSDLTTALRSGSIEVVDLTAPLSAETPLLELPPEFGQTAQFQLEEIS